MLSPKRDLIAAKLFLRLALSGGAPRPRVINVDGHPAYASAVAELKQTGELGRHCRCRTAPYLNNIPDAFIEIEDKPGFVGEVRITGKDPASMLPGAKSIAAEPSPQGGATDLGDQTLRNHALTDLLDRETGQRKSEAVRKARRPVP